MSRPAFVDVDGRRVRVRVDEASNLATPDDEADA